MIWISPLHCHPSLGELVANTAAASFGDPPNWLWKSAAIFFPPCYWEASPQTDGSWLQTDGDVHTPGGVPDSSACSSLREPDRPLRIKTLRIDASISVTFKALLHCSRSSKTNCVQNKLLMQNFHLHALIFMFLLLSINKYIIIYTDFFPTSCCFYDPVALSFVCVIVRCIASRVFAASCSSWRQCVSLFSVSVWSFLFPCISCCNISIVLRLSKVPHGLFINISLMHPLPVYPATNVTYSCLLLSLQFCCTMLSPLSASDSWTTASWLWLWVDDLCVKFTNIEKKDTFYFFVTLCRCASFSNESFGGCAHF